MYNYMIVDDEALIRQGTLKKIEKLQLPVNCVAEASNGREAMVHLEQAEIDFVITDMDMPEVDGIQLLDYLQRHYPKLPVIIISGYQNFNYLQKSIQANAVNYILKPFSKEDLRTSLDAVLEKLIRRQQQRGGENELIFQNLLGNDSTHAVELWQQQLRKLPEARLIIFSGGEFIPDTGNFHHQLGDNSYQVALCDGQTLSEKQGAAKGLMGVSEVIEPTEMPEVYFQQCVTALNQRHLHDKRRVYFQQSQSEDKPLPLMPYITEICYFIESGQQSPMQERLSESFANLLAQDVSLLALKQAGLSLLEQVKNLIDELFATHSNHTLPAFKVKLLQEYFDFEETIQLLTGFLTNITKAMTPENPYDSENLVENICQYLKRHYAEPITLELLGELFFHNPSYLSTLFKEQTGSKYIDYLNRIRIDQAQRLLKKTNRSATQIARTVGYDNPKYFYRVFKKYSDQTPEQFRKQS